MRGGAVLVLGLPGPELDDFAREALARVRPGGIILFKRNLEGAEQLRELVGEIRGLVPETLLYVDAEGGTVHRFAELVGPAPAGEVLAAAPPELARETGALLGAALRAFDCDVTYAPVLDLDRGERGNALGGRYLGREPDDVVERGRAFIAGAHAAGAGTCVKHFPGLGGAREDTHDLPARIDLSRIELERDLEPFRRLLDEAGSVMLAHASYPALDPEERPASLSPPIVSGLLRRELGFDGMAVSDDLDMRALAPWGDLGARGVAALEAGCDAVPLCLSFDAAAEVAGRLERVDAERLAEAAARCAAYRDLVLGRRRGPRPELQAVRDRLAALSERAAAWARTG